MICCCRRILVSFRLDFVSLLSSASALIRPTFYDRLCMEVFALVASAKEESNESRAPILVRLSFEFSAHCVLNHKPGMQSL